ncbi:type II toxin-antitoxin system VapC family toxin [Pseudonocardia hispaniensis]|uniref:Type II toxin-antitoxin system VapC family toxin n=1 Tax=Pseudonocardia hispaniensis TaxID=904933 RepID=A0ABW1IWU1_9PSEU
MSAPDPAPDAPPSGGPTVLDASAVLAWLRAEPGAEVVQGYLDDAVISTVNLSEVHQKLAQHGVDADRTVRRLRTLGLRVEPLGIEDALTASRLWPATRQAGLSLGDRCCLALAARLDSPAVTADTAWTCLDVGVSVVPIR